MKVALVYDRINKFGGAERVLTALHHLWPDAPIFTSVYHPAKATWARDITIKTSFLNQLPSIRDKHEFLAPLMPYAFESFNFDDYDLIISVTSAEAKGIITKPHQLHLCYLLTPTRYLWSHTHHYRSGRFSRLKLYYLSQLRRWDFLAAQRPDFLLPISTAVASRIKKYYRVNPLKPLFPPIDANFFTPDESIHKIPHRFLLVSRLVSYKSVDTAIKAFNLLPQKQLYVIGTGHEFSRLRSLASTNIHFMGQVSDQVLRDHYRQAQALIHPQEEDFGLTALEAQSCGTPVIALGRGGVLDTISPAKTGLLYSQNNPQSLIEALRLFDTHTWDHKLIMKHAKKFDITNFELKFNRTVTQLWQNHLK